MEVSTAAAAKLVKLASTVEKARTCRRKQGLFQHARYADSTLES